MSTLLIELSRTDALEADIEVLIGSHPEWTDWDLPVEVAYEMRLGELRWVKRTVVHHCPGSTVDPKQTVRLGLRRLLRIMRNVHHLVKKPIQSFHLRIRTPLEEDRLEVNNGLEAACP